jgi:hypothetical protein
LSVGFFRLLLSSWSDTLSSADDETPGIQRYRQSFKSHLLKGIAPSSDAAALAP